jgi:hypothetical protein
MTILWERAQGGAQPLNLLLLLLHIIHSLSAHLNGMPGPPRRKGAGAGGESFNQTS